MYCTFGDVTFGDVNVMIKTDTTYYYLYIYLLPEMVGGEGSKSTVLVDGSSLELAGWHEVGMVLT